MASYFITATGTGTGKTYVTAGLIKAGRELKKEIAAIKPVMSGYDPAEAAESDAGILLEAMGRPATPINVATISPWRFTAPLSPDMAGVREGKRVGFDDLLTFCKAAGAAARGPLLIEGVGGVAVPLNDDMLVADWIAALKIPALLVGGTYLGSISHTLSALGFLVQQNIKIAGVVLSESPASPVLPEETAATLERFITCPIHIIPRDFDDGTFRKIAARL
jgi:dethiobiotin synthetase